MFGLGFPELLVLAILGIGMVTAVVVVWLVVRKSSNPSVGDLEEENRRLRREVDRLKRGE